MSKIIISHDVDHLSSYEHTRDLIVPKYIGRSLFEFFYGTTTGFELSARFHDVIYGKWNRIRELSDFNKMNDIKSTFFFGVSSGSGMSYSPEKAKELLNYVIAAGHQVGVHGVSHLGNVDVNFERDLFCKVYGVDCTGIRFHYLHNDFGMLNLLDAAGYLYDSSFRGDSSAFQIDRLVHFPLHIMDGDVFFRNKRYQSIGVEEAIKFTKTRIEDLIDKDVNFISLLFHDRYFCDAHSSWRDWYMSTIEWIRSQKIETTTYEGALAEFESVR